MTGDVPGRIVVDGKPMAFEPGDSVAIAMIRAGTWPGRGGTLCLAGDCGNCLADVDGIVAAADSPKKTLADYRKLGLSIVQA